MPRRHEIEKDSSLRDVHFHVRSATLHCVHRLCVGACLKGVCDVVYIQATLERGVQPSQTQSRPPSRHSLRKLEEVIAVMKAAFGKDLKRLARK